MARRQSEVYVFSHVAQADGHRFVPSGILRMTETGGANLRNRELASEFAYPSWVPGRRQAERGPRPRCATTRARRCGLTVPEVRHLDLGGRSVMLIRRFDR